MNSAAQHPLAKHPLAFGAATVGNLYREVSDERAWAVLDAAWQAGIRHFDTAPHYGIGLSERRLGAFLQTKPRDEFVISTKVGRILEPVTPVEGDDMQHDFAVPKTHVRRYDYSADGIRRSLDDSLERLGLDRVDVLYLHDPELAAEGTDAALAAGLPAVASLRDQGVVRGVGIGSKDLDALSQAAVSGFADTLMISAQYTLLEQAAGERLLPLMLEQGVRGVAVSIFNSGLLAKPRPASDARYDYGSASAELVARAHSIADVCEAHGVDLPTAAIAYPLRHEAMVACAVSASSSEQVEQTAARAAVDVPDALWSDLTAAGLIP
ncbi:aldo/keto reductase [Agrococcus casei]|uniref:L-fuco-beta-pyranose dehydrogenase n=1 Tax=Agrococcus casei LMG 22410 TaxID=1255656 RepID=A0A1R4F1X3_9MICO|nr:aldo/keto reductase [Agrococcus casei]SJM49919.1 L-fuco-beta-pyranose dehydrogenase [Agrococcus casei LMG 22410]